MTASRAAYFVIADISGYTRFLSTVELEHAHDIIGDLMTVIVKALRPPLRLAKFEGDAVFLYAASEQVDGAMLQDAIEGAYFAFRRRLRNISRSTTCTCQACSLIKTLDLKFVCHHGEYVEHVMAGRKELAGKDVIVVHRFLKNSVVEGLGLAAYALYSDACIHAMRSGTEAPGLVPHVETIDLIGEVTCRVRDLHAAWQAENDTVRDCVSREEAVLVLEHDYAAPPATVWEYLTVPSLRVAYQSTDGVVEQVVSSRRGVGTTNHCMHGKSAVVEEIVDWRPFEYFTFWKLLPMPGASKIKMTFALEETATGGTHVEVRVARPAPRAAAFVESVAPLAVKKYTAEFASLAEVLGARSEDGSMVPEPALDSPRS